MGWKDYFYFTRSERNGITVLILAIVLALVIPQFYRYFQPEQVWEKGDFINQVSEYNRIIAEYNAAKQHLLQEESLEKNRFGDSFTEKIELNPYHFDPNSLTHEGFLAMGIPERIANNIINYRNAGGKFRFKEDVEKIYSIDENLYAQLAPFIELPARSDHQAVSDNLAPSSETSIPSGRGYQAPSLPTVLIEINKADTFELQQLRGIGSVFSKRIISYRNLLGGFYSPHQLLEVYGMDSTRFQGIIDNIEIDTVSLIKININTADFATLLRHPYLNRNQVNSIIQMRERHGQFKNPSDIKRSELISENDFIKLAPYLITQDN